jgi:hypothetical protein
MSLRSVQGPLFLFVALRAATAAAAPTAVWAPPACDPALGAGAASAAGVIACCWPGQWWSPEQARCVGAPGCPGGFTAVGESCVATCPDGQQITEETGGHCCWKGQVWSLQRARCVGIPECPPGRGARGEECVPGCPPGQSASEDTGGRCCWPGQAWSTRRQTCVGIPLCPGPLVAGGESCVSRAVPAAPSAPTAIATPLPSVAPPIAPAVTARKEQRPRKEAAPEAPTVDVRIVAERPADSLLVEYGGATPCTTPCNVEVPRGKLHLSVFGDARFATDVDVPRSSTLRVYRSRGGYRTAGGVLLAAAIVSALSSTSLYFMVHEPGTLGIAIGLDVLAATFLGTGIGLVAVAGHDGVRVVGGGEASATVAPSGIRLAGIGLSPSAHGVSTSFLLRF